MIDVAFVDVANGDLTTEVAMVGDGPRSTSSSTRRSDELIRWFG